MKTIYEDEDAKKRGWKHVGFGTYEDQSGRRYRKNKNGGWAEVGKDSPATATRSGNVHAEYEARVGELEQSGMDRSDAQGVADLEFNSKYGKGWEQTRLREMISKIARKVLVEELQRRKVWR